MVVVSKTDVCAKCGTKTGGDFYCTSRDGQTLTDKIAHKGKIKADKPVKWGSTVWKLEVEVEITY